MDQINPKYSFSKADKKTIEKNRRNQMKSLFSMLDSLIPHQSREITVSLSEQLERATEYIKKLQSTLDSMKQKKELLMRMRMRRSSFTKSSSSSSGADSSGYEGVKLPKIQVHSNGSSLDVVLITELNHQYIIFTEMMRILHQECVDVMSASFSVVDDRTVFYTIHSKIGGCGLECEATRISEKLRKLVFYDETHFLY